jgi:hypothetical protein
LPLAWAYWPSANSFVSVSPDTCQIAHKPNGGRGVRRQKEAIRSCLRHRSMCWYQLR